MDLCSPSDWEKWNKISKLENVTIKKFTNTKIQGFFWGSEIYTRSFSPTENFNDVNIFWIMLEKTIIASTVAAI